MATPAEIRQHYDSLALIYRAFWGNHLHHGLFLNGDRNPEIAQLRMLKHCAHAAEVRNGEEVLDAGCGHGGTSNYLAWKYGCRVLGLTLSEKQARLARENAAAANVSQRTHFETADVNRYEFPRERFDLVWTMESSEHFAEKNRYFANVRNCLRPGGRLLVAAWTGNMKSPSIRAVAQAFLCPELWSPAQYCAAIQNCGLEIQRSENLSSQVVPTWEICHQRAHAARSVVKLLPRSAREFVQGIETILGAYRSGDLTYTVIVARKPFSNPQA
jgi:cyclopropane fatty-acyl-phospholipid synthase-like methyltransferase